MVSAREGRRTRAFPLYAVVLAIGVLLVVLLVGWLAWIDAQANHDKALRTSRVYGAHVESVLGDLFHKTDILEAIVVTQDGELSEETFLSLAESLGEGIGIRSIQCLPGGVVRYLHPLAGNEAVLGDNVFSDPYRKVDAQLAVDTKSITLSGSYELTQGGIGLIARNPVFLQNERGEDEFWGFTVIVLDMPDALEPVGLAELASEGYRYELLASSEEGDSLVVDASEEPPSEDAEEYDVSVPNHTWKLRLSPADGWVNVDMLACIGVLGLSVSVLLAVVVRQEQKRRADGAAQPSLVLRDGGAVVRRAQSSAVLAALPRPRRFQRGERHAGPPVGRYAARAGGAPFRGSLRGRMRAGPLGRRRVRRGPAGIRPRCDKAGRGSVEARARRAVLHRRLRSVHFGEHRRSGVSRGRRDVRRASPCGRPAYVRGEAPQINSGYAHSCLPSDAVGACEHFRRMGRRMPMPLPWRRVRAAARRIVDTAKVWNCCP